VDVGLYAVDRLVEHLTSQAERAQRRFPLVDTQGNRVLPPRPREPLALLRWWQDLTPADHRRLIERRTEWVGNADGLPTAARHAANTRLLEGEIARRAHLIGRQPGDLGELGVEDRRDLRGLIKLRALLRDDPHTEGLADITTPRQQRYPVPAGRRRLSPQGRRRTR
jgi:hypothetical protein